MSISSVCIYCGSTAPQKYKDAAQKIAGQLAQHGVQLVYGGSRRGLMGVIADAALAAGGKVVGIIPTFLRSVETEHKGLTEIHVVPDLHTRKRMMFERSDAFLILPGGLGTLDEAFEMITWRKLKLHNKPIIIFNQDGYWDGFVALVQKTIDEGFSTPEAENPWFVVANSVEEVFKLLSEARNSHSATMTERM